jgi:hypothetical protein
MSGPQLGEQVSVRLACIDRHANVFLAGPVVSGPHIGLGMVVHRSPHAAGLWSVTCQETGLAVSPYASVTRRDAVQVAWARVRACGDALRLMRWRNGFLPGLIGSGPVRL